MARRKSKIILPLDEVVEQLRILQRRRRFFIQSKNANTSRVTHHLFGIMVSGHGELKEGERKHLWDEAERIVTAYLDDKYLEGDDAVLAEDTKGDLNVARMMLEPARTRLKEIVRDMECLARLLPVRDFQKRTTGLGELGLSALVGEAGDFSKYPTDHHLLKRLGLTPFTRTDGVTRASSTWRMLGGLSKDEWSDDIETGYKGPGYRPQRRATVYADVEDSLRRAQWRGDKTHPSGKAGPIGPYGEIFGTYKARQLALNEAGAFRELAEAIAASLKKNHKLVPQANLDGKLTPKHIDNRAKRYMVQRLVSDLWSEWRRAIGEVPEKPSGYLPAAKKLKDAA